MYFVKSTWRGEKSLVFTFWVMNIVGVTALSLIMTYLGAVASTQCENVVFLLFWVIFLLFFISYSLFSLVATWRSAGKYIDNAMQNNVIGSNNPFWGYATRLVVTISVGRIIIALISEFF